MNVQTIPPVPGMIDLACSRHGAKVCSASDDFFAEKENLIKESAPIFLADKYTENGKWMDGWESRRKRDKGHDWCIIKLAYEGQIHSVDIDTSFFRGNHPPFASVMACESDNEPAPDSSLWEEIIPQCSLKENSGNLFAVTPRLKPRFEKYNYIKLNIFPDGGVARLKIYGTIPENPKALSGQKGVNLFDFSKGASAVCCSDAFFSPMQNLLLPDMPSHMGEGWETRRKRHPGHDWVILKAACPGILTKISISTKFFKGNFPDRFSLESCFLGTANTDQLLNQENLWKPLLHETPMIADSWHEYEKELRHQDPVSHIRLNIFPDGGIARFRGFGDPIDL